ncbi:RNA polymerase II elongation factor ELL2 [Araneus ventricosus]|uniref:RNA polymerase II elongation factor ELL2 n=1 Tax=Araneus ventricosus TaxID=182803 RepID=A0A4Y2QXL3_ARAVE|nr:RNA polymerase II elongation factor ELL2 [Araneus ventricosus]
MNTIGPTDLISPRKTSRKSAVLMRVPDDILSLLENYALNRNASSSKLTIKFDGSTGVIKIPNEGNNEIFSFNISDNTTTRDSTYCVKENENRTLETVALMQQKINIKPGSSSFERTRSKMTDQRKKNPCKRIEMVDSLTEPSSKKVTAKCPRSTTATSNSTNLNGNKNKKYIPYQGFDIVSQPLRKRIVHILALKPYKKPELLARLIQEGISELDKNRVTITLHQVATVRKELYYLDLNKWNEVEDDWRFYSPEDAATIQKRKQEHCRPNVNPAPSNQPNNGHSKKRSLVDEIIASSSYPVQKKQKKTNAKEENLGVPSILQYVTNSSTKGYLSSASGAESDTVRGPPLLSSIKRQDFSPKGYLSPASDIKNPKDQVSLPTSSKKKRKKKKKNRKDIKKNTDKKNDKKKKNKKRKKSKRKNRKKKDHFNNTKINSIGPAKTVDSEITITNTAHHKVFSHVELGSQNSKTELNNKTDKKKEKHPVSSKRAFKENFEVSSRQQKKKKSDMVIFPTPVCNQSFDLSGIESVNIKSQNESARKIEKTSYNAECFIGNVKTARSLSPKRAYHTENKVNEKISDGHGNKNSVIFNFGLNNLVNKFSKNKGINVNNERKCSVGNFKFKDFPTQGILYPNEREEKNETNLFSTGELFSQSSKTTEVNSCHSVDFTSPQQSSPEEDILDALFFGDDSGHATPEDNILGELFFGDDQVEENTNLSSIIEHNSLGTDIVIDQINKTSSISPPQDSCQIKKIGSPPGVPSSTVEEHVVKCTNTMSAQISKTSSVFTPEDFSKTKKITSPPEVPSSTVEEHIAKCTNSDNRQMSKTSSVFTPEDSAQRKKITSPSAVPSSTVDDITVGTDTVCSGPALSFRGDSSLVQETKVQILKEKQSNNSSQVFGQPTHSHTEFENFDSFHLKSEETYKKRIFPSSVMESVELFSKVREFVPVDCLSNYDPQVCRTLGLSSFQSTSKMLFDHHHDNLVLQGAESVNHDAYNFKKQFCKITSFKQRAKYKECFNSKYPAYLKLHKRITMAEERLTRLEENFKTLKEGTQEYKVALNEMVRVYKMYFHDTQYNKFCQSRALLHDKLSYIRSLILEFDNEQLRNMLI